MALREILAKFGFEVDTHNIDAGQKKMGELKEAFIGFTEVLVGGAALEGIKSFIEGQVQAGAALGNQAAMLGVSTDELQRMQYAFMATGSSSEEATGAMTKFNKAIGSAALGNKEANKEFASLGISVKDANGEVRPMNDILMDVSEKMGGMHSQAEKTALSMKLFGRGGAKSINAIGGGKEKLEELNKEFDELGGGMSKDFVADAKKAEEQGVKFDLVMARLKSTVVQELLPGFESIVLTFMKFAKSATDVVKKSNIMKVVFAGLAAAALYLAGTGLMGLATAFGEAALGALGLESAMLPMWAVGLLIAVAIAALVLIIEDLYTMFTGGNSVIGDFIDSLFGIGSAKAVVVGLNNAFDDWMPTISAVGAQVVDIVVGAFQTLWSIVVAVGHAIAAVFELMQTMDFKKFGASLLDAAKDVGDAVKKSIDRSAGDLNRDFVKEYADKKANAKNEKDQKEQADAFAKLTPAQKAAAKKKSDAEYNKIPVPSPDDVNPGGVRQPKGFTNTTGDGANVTQNTTNNIQIHGVKDPEGTKVAVGDALHGSEQARLRAAQAAHRQGV